MSQEDSLLPLICLLITTLCTIAVDLVFSLDLFLESHICASQMHAPVRWVVQTKSSSDSSFK